MNTFYVIYINMKEGTVIFSALFSSFSQAKNNIDDFLAEYAKKINKPISFLSKDELEKLKISKKIDDNLYIRKKDSNAIIYFRNTLTGTFYNTYSLQKYAHLGINEFILPLPGNPKREIKDIHITNRERGSHVNVITELKTVLHKKNIEDKELKERNKEEHEDNCSQREQDKMSIFIRDLMEGKKKLKSVPKPIEKVYF